MVIIEYDLMEIESRLNHDLTMLQKNAGVTHDQTRLCVLVHFHLRNSWQPLELWRPCPP
jgi:hypothetical protein